MLLVSQMLFCWCAVPPFPGLVMITILANIRGGFHTRDMVLLFSSFRQMAAMINQNKKTKQIKRKHLCNHVKRSRHSTTGLQKEISGSQL